MAIWSTTNFSKYVCSELLLWVVLTCLTLYQLLMRCWDFQGYARQRRFWCVLIVYFRTIFDGKLSETVFFFFFLTGCDSVTSATFLQRQLKNSSLHRSCIRGVKGRRVPRRRFALSPLPTKGRTFRRTSLIGDKEAKKEGEVRPSRARPQLLVSHGHIQAMSFGGLLFLFSSTVRDI